MGNVINLRHARKTKTRDQAEKDAAANRIKHGTSKASRVAAKIEKTRANDAVDAHKIERE